MFAQDIQDDIPKESLEGSPSIAPQHTPLPPFETNICANIMPQALFTACKDVGAIIHAIAALNQQVVCKIDPREGGSITPPKSLAKDGASFTTVSKRRAAKKAQAKPNNKLIRPQKCNMFKDLDGKEDDSSGANTTSTTVRHD